MCVDFEKIKSFFCSIVRGTGRCLEGQEQLVEKGSFSRTTRHQYSHIYHTIHIMIPLSRAAHAPRGQGGLRCPCVSGAALKFSAIKALDYKCIIWLGYNWLIQYNNYRVFPTNYLNI